MLAAQMNNQQSHIKTNYRNLKVRTINLQPQMKTNHLNLLVKMVIKIKCCGGRNV
jgi:hypothetical protein